MYQMFEIGTSLAECFLVHIFFQNWFGQRPRSRWQFWVCYLTFFAVNCGFTLLPMLPAFRAVLGAVCVLGVALYLYQTTVQTAVLGSALYVALTVLAEYVVLVVLSATSFETADLLVYGKERVLYNVLAKLLNLITVLFASVILGRNKADLTMRQVFSFLPCHLISIYVCHVFYKFAETTPSVPFSFVLVLLGLLYLNFMLVILMERLSESARVQRQQALEEQQFLMQQHYYAQVQQDQAETHALWHDIKKYMTAMQAMVDTGNSQAAAEELSFLEDAFSKIGNLVDIGNSELNVILNYWLQHANAAGVTLHLTADVPSQVSVSAVDLSVMIGNTMDNAIAACQVLPNEQRVIDVMLCQRNHMLFYTIENFCIPNQPPKPGKIHGYGLRNVKACVENYGGSMTIEASGEKYCVSIRLNLSN